MRSRAATPLIERNGCVQHDTAFVAKIRSLPAAGKGQDMPVT
jgi:hypothetical protein